MDIRCPPFIVIEVLSIM